VALLITHSAIQTPSIVTHTSQYSDCKMLYQLMRLCGAVRGSHRDTWRHAEVVTETPGDMSKLPQRRLETYQLFGRKMSQNSVNPVESNTYYTLGFDSRRRQRFFYSPCQDGPCSLSSLLYNVYRGLFHGGQSGRDMKLTTHPHGVCLSVSRAVTNSGSTGSKGKMIGE
jgi:hypothetical protein